MDRSDALRKVVADAVLGDQLEYNEAVLGQPPDSYARWITNSGHWGGGIELAILSKHFAAEIAAFDCQTMRVDLFGEGCGHNQRIYLVYDGIHVCMLYLLGV